MILCKLLSGLFALIVRRRAARQEIMAAARVPGRYERCHMSEGWYTVGDRVHFRHVTGRWFDGVIVQAANPHRDEGGGPQRKRERKQTGENAGRRRPGHQRPDDYQPRGEGLLHAHPRRQHQPAEGQPRPAGRIDRQPKDESQHFVPLNDFGRTPARSTASYPCSLRRSGSPPTRGCPGWAVGGVGGDDHSGVCPICLVGVVEQVLNRPAGLPDAWATAIIVWLDRRARAVCPDRLPTMAGWRPLSTRP